MNKIKVSDKCFIYNDNCFDVLKGFPDNYVDLVLTDPPYGIDLTPQRDGGKFKNTKIINDNSLAWLPEYVSQIYRISKNCVFVFCGWQNID